MASVHFAALAFVFALDTSATILDRARQANHHVYEALQSFVCKENVDRFQGTISGDFAKAIDTFTVKLSFEKGIEQYSPSPQLRTGAWSEGEFGSLLLQTQQQLETEQVIFDSFADLEGVSAAVFRFEVPSKDSPWDLEVAARHYSIPFRTTVWISIASGEILKIDRTSSALAPETYIAQIQWSLTLGRVNLNGTQWLLPQSARYAVLYEGSRRRDWNVLRFSDYKRYGSETAVSFK